MAVRLAYALVGASGDVAPSSRPPKLTRASGGDRPVAPAGNASAASVVGRRDLLTVNQRNKIQRLIKSATCMDLASTLSPPADGAGISGDAIPRVFILGTSSES